MQVRRYKMAINKIKKKINIFQKNAKKNIISAVPSTEEVRLSVLRICRSAFNDCETASASSCEGNGIRIELKKNRNNE